MEYLLESWSLFVILVSAFVIGWGAETAQTFMSRALALSILAWLQTLPEFAVEASIAWNQQQDLMIANLTGSLRLLVGLGWPMIFFVHFFFQGMKKRKFIKEIHLSDEDAMGVLFLFLSIAYFVVVMAKATLTVWDAVILTILYVIYLVMIARQPAHQVEEEEDLPWIGKKIVTLEPVPKVLATVFLFVAGGVALYYSVHPFITTLEKWAVTFGISSFVFVQWVAPFLSEFPEKVSAFNWARQTNKASMAMMNMVNSNINQWTMLAAMIPVVFSLSIGRITAVELSEMHRLELALTIVQSALGGLLLLDMKFSLVDATIIFFLWFTQFLVTSLHEEVLCAYGVWIVWELIHHIIQFARTKHPPRAIQILLNK